jgi:hypothetical protein
MKVMEIPDNFASLALLEKSRRVALLGWGHSPGEPSFPTRDTHSLSTIYAIWVVKIKNFERNTKSERWKI